MTNIQNHVGCLKDAYLTSYMVLQQLKENGDPSSIELLEGMNYLFRGIFVDKNKRGRMP